jgi:hypothetical protein
VKNIFAAHSQILLKLHQRLEKLLKNFKINKSDVRTCFVICAWVARK